MRCGPRKLLNDENWEHVQDKLTEMTAEMARYEADELAAEADLRAATSNWANPMSWLPFRGVVGRRSVHDARR